MTEENQDRQTEGLDRALARGFSAPARGPAAKRAEHCPDGVAERWASGAAAVAQSLSEAAEWARAEAAARRRAAEDRIRASLEPLAEGLPDREAVNEAVRADPSDFWAQIAAARRCESDAPPDLPRAARFLAAAIALRPGSPCLWRHFGDILRALGEEVEASGAHERARDLEGR